MYTAFKRAPTVVDYRHLKAAMSFGNTETEPPISILTLHFTLVYHPQETAGIDLGSTTWVKFLKISKLLLLRCILSAAATAASGTATDGRGHPTAHSVHDALELSKRDASAQRNGQHDGQTVLGRILGRKGVARGARREENIHVKSIL